MLIYLATPYTSPSAKVREARAKQACLVAAELICRGYNVLAPIGFHHLTAISGGISCSWEVWARFDEEVLSRCDELWVVDMSGWKTSTGVNAEIIIARRLRKPVWLLNPKTCERVPL